MSNTSLNKALRWPNEIHSDLAHIEKFTADLNDAVAAGDEDLAGFYREVLTDLSHAHERAVQACEHVLTHGLGCTLKHASLEQWATFLPDASNPGQLRFQLYDENGFSSHATHSCLGKAAYDAASSGYCIPDDLAPERVFALPSFVDGNQINAVIQRANAGHLRFDEANDQIDAIRSHRNPAQGVPAAPPAMA